MTSTAAVAPNPFVRFHRAVALDSEALRRIRVVAVIGLIALNICDLLLTRQLLQMGGVEANPLMALVIHGPIGIAVKIGVPVLLAVRHLRAPLERKLVLGLCWACVLYLGVVIWNLSLLDSPHLLG